MKKRLLKSIALVNDADLTELNIIISFAEFADCHKKRRVENIKAKVLNHLFKKLDSYSSMNFRANGPTGKNELHKSSYLKAIQALVEFYSEEEEKKTNKDCTPS